MPRRGFEAATGIGYRITSRNSATNAGRNRGGGRSATVGSVTCSATMRSVPSGTWTPGKPFSSSEVARLTIRNTELGNRRSSNSPIDIDKAATSAALRTVSLNIVPPPRAPTNEVIVDDSCVADVNAGQQTS